MVTRRASTDDLAAIAEIQAATPEAAQWDPHEYLSCHCTVALVDGKVAGFVVTRQVAGDEAEILNLAVAPAMRRRGVGRRLLQEHLQSFAGTVFLEVRESNQQALRFYERLGFRMLTTRPRYYARPVESAIVMRFHSC